jgi:predicted nucleotidyltransferase
VYTQQELINKLTPIFRKYPIKRAALFGSYARGEQIDDSDVDIFLEIDYTNVLPDIVLTIWDDVESGINLKADVLTHGSLETAPKRFRERILNELRYIYEA